MVSTRIISSAPGKTILHGEHAVVFGKNAIAVSVNLRTTVTVDLNDCDKVVLAAENFGQTFSWTIDELSAINYVTKDVKNNVPQFNEQEVAKLDLLLKKFECDNHFALDTARSFLFILLNVANIFNKSKSIALTTNINSELPIGAGMGSSASFSVSLTGGLLKAFDVQNLSKELICSWSFECEKLFHGKPSGIDNSICTYGGAILFKNGQIIEKLNELNGFEIILVYTNVPRNTKKLVAKTSTRREQYPTVMGHILDAIDNISLTQWSQIKNGDDHDKIQTLVTINQNLLDSMGAGHPTIDDIVQTASKYSLASKLTGAGGGGTVFVLLKPDLENDTLESLLTELTTKGYRCWKVVSGSSGINLEVLKDEKERTRIF